MRQQRQMQLNSARWSARQRGVTLIELMIVVVIVGILASIAYPGYQQYVLRGKRTEGKALALEIAGRMERYYFDNNAYTTDLTKVGYSSANPASAEGHYTAAVAAGPSGAIATSYTITVTPVTGKHKDPECGALTLDSRGAKTQATGTEAKCWN